MPLVTTASLLAAAQAAGVGVGAFNVICIEHAEAVVSGATAAGRGVVLQVSQNAVAFHGAVRPLSAACVEVARAADVPVALHLDHVTDPALAVLAGPAGFSSLMFDGAFLDDAANAVATGAVARDAHATGLVVEAELGEVGGKPGAHAAGARTDPAAASAFVAATGVDALAVAVGSTHAMTSRTAELDLHLVARLRDAVPVPLVLHGSSGVPDTALAAAVRAGIVKVNVGTALNVAYTSAVRAALAADAGVVDPRHYLALARDDMTAVVAHLCRVLSLAAA